MKELKGLRIKFVVSNMAMVSLVIGLAFLLVGGLMNFKVEQNQQRLLGEAASMENFREVLWQSQRTRMPFFILVTDGEDKVIQMEGQYGGLEPDEELMQDLAARSLSGSQDMGELEPYQLSYLRRPFENGYRITYVDTSMGNAFTADMWRTLGIIGGAVWLALLAASCFLSKWAVDPVEHSVRREKQFVADASHELKTPLTVIMANAQLLAEENHSKTGDESRWLDNILQEAEEMKRLVEEMLTLARNEAAGFGREKKVFSLSDVVIESVLSFEAAFYQEDKELESDVEEGICIRGDLCQFGQVMGILLDNAKKYSPAGGRAKVRLERLGNKKARLLVENAGEEIPQDKLELIFDRFYRSDASRGEQEGYGLGLAIAKSIVEGSGGRIYARSQDGKNQFFVEIRTASNQDRRARMAKE